jgi:hypothetical protein
MTNVPDWLAALAIVVPAATGVLGYLLAGFNEEKRDQRAAEREREARRAIVVQQADDRRHDYQREVLLELQSVILEFAISIVKAFDASQHPSKHPGERDPLDPEILELRLRMARLRERVLDDQLRDILGLLDRNSATAVISAAEDFSTVAEAASEIVVAVNSRLGELLRQELGRMPELESPPTWTE